MPAIAAAILLVPVSPAVAQTDSPARHVGRATPPTSIVHGERDRRTCDIHAFVSTAK
jgi:hypothetical protein